MSFSELSRALTADEAAELGPPPNPDIETPTTGRSDGPDQSIAVVHLPGVESAVAAVDGDVLPDPISTPEGN